MHLTNDMSRWQLVVMTFGQDTVAASQTDVQISRVIGEAAQTVDNSVAPWEGFIAGIAYSLSAAGTAGTFTIGATINGTENATTTQTVGTTTEGYATFDDGKVPFVPGDNIGVEITTNGSWDGTTADLVVDVYVCYRVTGL